MRKVCANKRSRKTLCYMRNILLSSDVLLFISPQFLMSANFSRIFSLIHLKHFKGKIEKPGTKLKLKKKLATNVKVSAKGKQYKKPSENKSSLQTLQLVLLFSKELL